MQFFPKRCCVIARKIESSEPKVVTEGGISYTQEGVDIYEIMDLSLDGFDKPFQFSIGNKVTSCEATKKVQGTDDIYVLNPEYITSKILN